MLGGGHAYEAVSFVVGAFVDLSSGCCELINAIVRVRALNHLPFFECKRPIRCGFSFLDSSILAAVVGDPIEGTLLAFGAGLGFHGQHSPPRRAPT